MKPGDDFGRAGLLLFAERVSRCVIRGRRTLSRRSNARTGVVRTHIAVASDRAVPIADKRSIASLVPAFSGVLS